MKKNYYKLFNDPNVVCVGNPTHEKWKRMKVSFLEHINNKHRAGYTFNIPEHIQRRIFCCLTQALRSIDMERSQESGSPPDTTHHHHSPLTALTLLHGISTDNISKMKNLCNLFTYLNDKVSQSSPTFHYANDVERGKQSNVSFLSIYTTHILHVLF